MRGTFKESEVSNGAGEKFARERRVRGDDGEEIGPGLHV